MTAEAIEVKAALATVPPTWLLDQVKQTQQKCHRWRRSIAYVSNPFSC